MAAIWRSWLIHILIFATLRLEARSPKKVGIVVQGPPVKGIFRDAESLVWALTSTSRRTISHTTLTLSVFYTHNYALLDQVPLLSPKRCEHAVPWFLRTFATNSPFLECPF